MRTHVDQREASFRGWRSIVLGWLLCTLLGCVARPSAQEGAVSNAAIDASAADSSFGQSGDAGHRRSRDAGQSGNGGEGGAAGAGGLTGQSGSAVVGGVGGMDGQANAAAGSGGAEPASCGIDSDLLCLEDQYCKSVPDQDCGPIAIGGVCYHKETACADLYHGVCGCDNRTYGNECSAHTSGVAIKHEGNCNADECAAAGGRVLLNNDGNTRCDEDIEEWWLIGKASRTKLEDLCCRPKPAPSKMCGGIAGLSCEQGQFCNQEQQGCATADGAGVCEPIPNGWCTRDYWPVCGCDRRTYSNACEAHSKGISVLHDGACTEGDCAAAGGKVFAGMCKPDDRFAPVQEERVGYESAGRRCMVARAAPLTQC